MPDQTVTPLAQWMRDNNVRDRWLAEKIGCTQPQACRIRKGARTSPERAFAIESLTEGQVKAASLLLSKETASA